MAKSRIYCTSSQLYSKLKSCYENCLQEVLENNIKSIAFCCIATGIYGFDQKQAAKIALSTIREWLDIHHEIVDRVIFCFYDGANSKKSTTRHGVAQKGLFFDTPLVKFHFGNLFHVQKAFWFKFQKSTPKHGIEQIGRLFDTTLVKSILGN